MIGMVIVTHGSLANEFKLALEHVVGIQHQTIAINIAADDDMEARREDIKNAVAEVDDGSGVILLTDLFGGTPSNLSISLMQDNNVEVIAGINLPMLVKLSGLRENTDLNKAVELAQEAGRKYIQVASQLLKGEQ